MDLIKEVEKLEAKIELLELENRMLKQSIDRLDLNKTMDELTVYEVRGLFKMLELTVEQGEAIFFK